METKSTRGRKRLYHPEKMKIGEKMKMNGKMRLYPYAYAQTFNERGAEKFRVVIEENRPFLERIL